MPSEIIDLEWADILDNILNDRDEKNRTFNAEAKVLYSAESGKDQQLAHLQATRKGLSLALGEKGRRNGAPKIQGPDIQLTGQITTVGQSVTGYGTLFLSELVEGDRIYVASLDEYHVIDSITTNELATLVTAFSSNVTPQEDVYKQGTLAQRVWHITGDATKHTVDSDMDITGALDVAGLLTAAAVESKSNPGFWKSPSGIILQWGSDITASSGVFVNWPTAFSARPAAIFTRSVAAVDGSQKTDTLDFTWTSTQYKYNVLLNHNVSAPYHDVQTYDIEINFFAIGY
jgi:hypothetical protein